MNGEPQRIAFVSYYQGDYGIHTLDRKEPLHTAASEDFGSPGPVIDFQAPLTHSLVSSNVRKKGRFEKMFLEGRPPVNVGVTSNGDVFGGTQISFGDVLGDQQFNVYADSVAQYRTLAGSYVNLARRFQLALQGFSQTRFFYGALAGAFYDPALAGLISRDEALATRTTRGGTVFGIYPLDRFRRLELTAGLVWLHEAVRGPGRSRPISTRSRTRPASSTRTKSSETGRSFLSASRSSRRRRCSVSSVRWPAARCASRYDFAPKFGRTLYRQTFDTDARYYLRLATSGVLALQVQGIQELRRLPRFPVLRRQLGNARIRLPAVRRAERDVRERRAEVPDHRSGLDARSG